MRTSLRGLALALLLASAGALGACGGGGVQSGGSVAGLAGLYVSAGELSPAFATEVTEYAVNLAAGDAVVQVTPRAHESVNHLTLDGEPILTGAASVPLPVGPEGRVVTVVVTSAGTGETWTYRIRFDRTATILSGLEVSVGSLDPVFDPFTTSYTVGLPYPTAGVRITPTAATPGSTILVKSLVTASGTSSLPIPLPTERTLITIEVRGPGGIGSSLYTIYFDRTFATLSGLTTSQGALAPGFGRGRPTYEVLLNATISSVTLTPSVDDPFATIQIDGLVVPAGVPTAPIALTPTFTPVEIVVTARDGTTRTTYRVVFDRVAAALADLTLAAGPFEPGFGAATTSYALVVGLGAESTTLTPTAADPDATITVNGTPTASGAASAPVPLALGLTPVIVEVTARDHATKTTYTVLFDRKLAGQEAYLKGPAPGATRLGHVVAISGDTLVVGAPFDGSGATGVDGDPSDDSAPRSGAAHVFVRTGTTWTRQAYLKPSNTGELDAFGSSVAISGDTVVVGAPAESGSAQGVDGAQDDGLQYAGAAYVFVRAGTTWSQQAYLKASNTQASQGFGESVAVVGDTVAVGTGYENSPSRGVNGSQVPNTATGGASGAVYVFVRDGSTWSQQAYLKAGNSAPNLRFGASLAMSGESLAVGATGNDALKTGISGGGDEGTNRDARDSGAAYVFVREGTTWKQQAYIKASNTDMSDYFGRSLALSGDTLCVGALGERSNATGVDGDQADDSTVWAGAVYVFTRSGTTWSQEAYLKAFNHPIYFSSGVAISGNTIVVGASYEDSSATGFDGDLENDDMPGSGAVYVYTRDASGWSPYAYVKASNTGAGDSFGGSVAVDGDTVVVGAALEASAATEVNGDESDDSLPHAGAVYVFR